MLKAMKQYKRWLRGQNRKFNRTINRRSTLTSQQDHPWKRKHFCTQVRVRSKYQNRKIKTHRGKILANLDPLNGTEKDCKNKTDLNWITLSEDDCTAQVVETSVTVNNNSPIQDYVHPDDEPQATFEMTPGFKPFTVCQNTSQSFCN